MYNLGLCCREIMLALHLNDRHEFVGSRGTRVLPVHAWETARPQLGAWIRAIRSGELGSKRISGPYLSLVKIPDEHPVCLLVGVSQFKLAELKFHRLKDIPTEDREILRDWFSSLTSTGLSSASGHCPSILEIIIGESLPSACMKWTKDMRLLFNKQSRDRKGSR